MRIVTQIPDHVFLAAITTSFPWLYMQQGRVFEPDGEPLSPRLPNAVAIGTLYEVCVIPCYLVQ